MSKYWKGYKNIECPCYEGERERSIYCYGIISEKNRSDFATSEDKQMYKIKNCFHYENNCPIRKIYKDREGV